MDDGIRRWSPLGSPLRQVSVLARTPRCPRQRFTRRTDGATVPTSAIGGAPLLGGSGSLVVDPSGRLAYLATGADIVAYRLDDAAGTPSLIGVVASGVTEPHAAYGKYPTAPGCELTLD